MSHLLMPSMLGQTIAAWKLFVKANAEAGHLLVILSHFVRDLFAYGVLCFSFFFLSLFFSFFWCPFFLFFPPVVCWFACDFTMKAITLVDVTCFCLRIFYESFILKVFVCVNIMRGMNLCKWMRDTHMF